MRLLSPCELGVLIIFNFLSLIRQGWRGASKLLYTPTGSFDQSDSIISNLSLYLSLSLSESHEVRSS